MPRSLLQRHAKITRNRAPVPRSRGGEVLRETLSYPWGGAIAARRPPRQVWSGLVDDFNPVGVLAHWVLLELGELSACFLNRIARQAVGQLSDRQ